MVGGQGIYPRAVANDQELLTPGQRRTQEIIEKLGFGVIAGLTIHAGQPCFSKPHRILQQVRIGSELRHHPDRKSADFTLTKEFDSLFDQLSQLRDGVVDIEIRHSRPFRLVQERSYEELVS